jgi:hypothetical protein
LPYVDQFLSAVLGKLEIHTLPFFPPALEVLFEELLIEEVLFKEVLFKEVLFKEVLFEDIAVELPVDVS